MRIRYHYLHVLLRYNNWLEVPSEDYNHSLCFGCIIPFIYVKKET